MKSAKHKELQKIISDYYRKAGWISVIEHSANGKKIDVLAQNIRTKQILANEIELSPRYCLENVTRDLNAGCTLVIIICENSAILEEIRQKVKNNLNKNMISKVSFRLISEFIPHTSIIKQQQIKEYGRI